MSELSEQTRELLEKGKHGEPGASDEARRRMKLAVLAAATASGAGISTATAATSTLLGVPVKVIIGGALLAAVGSTGAVMLSAERKVPPAPVSTTHTHAPTAPTFEPAGAAEPEASLAPSVPTEKPVAPPMRARTMPVEPAPASTLDEETALLRGAEEALRSGQAARSVALIDAYMNAFPRGVLLLEAKAERVFALCEAGRTDDAKKAAAVFVAEEPEGPLAARVRRSCAYAEKK